MGVDQRGRSDGLAKSQVSRRATDLPPIECAVGWSRCGGPADLRCVTGGVRRRDATFGLVDAINPIAACEEIPSRLSYPRGAIGKAFAPDGKRGARPGSTSLRLVAARVGGIDAEDVDPVGEIVEFF